MRSLYAKRECRNCGGEFQPRFPNQQTCRPCRKKWRRAYRRRYQRRMRRECKRELAAPLEDEEWPKDDPDQDQEPGDTRARS